MLFCTHKVFTEEIDEVFLMNSRYFKRNFVAGLVSSAAFL